MTKVALGEKEVQACAYLVVQASVRSFLSRALADSLIDWQIWFQNRRQNDRRRSRPLMPHEMIPHLKNSQYIPPTLGEPFSNPETMPSIENITPPSSCAPVNVAARSSSRSSSIHDLLNPDPPQGVTASHHPASSQAQEQSSSSSVDTSLKAVNEPTDQGDNVHRSKIATCHPKKRSYEETGSVNPTNEVQKENLPESSSERHPRIRLSRSLDGSVKVKTTDEDTPSPPKDRFYAVDDATPFPSNLQRSKSSNALKTATSRTSHTRSRPGSGSFGRSRDSRTWEFYCDSDARESLYMHAELERTGSAAGAIGLIRSSSKRGSDCHRQPLTPKLGGKNSKQHASEKIGKPKIARAMSSMARIQGNNANGLPLNSNAGRAEKGHKNGYPGHDRSPSTDSDKENWAPGTRKSIHPMRRQQSAFPAGSRPALRETSRVGSHVGRQGTTGTQRNRIADQRSGKKSSQDAEDVDEEVAAFMSGNAGGEEEDLDCVQGLLSLSQGAWK